MDFPLIYWLLTPFLLSEEARMWMRDNAPCAGRLIRLRLVHHIHGRNLVSSSYRVHALVTETDRAPRRTLMLGPDHQW
ncbi:hypothetical protein Br6_05080 [Rhodococcus sp. Br-6]|nr:hypothetical protein C8K36_12012 [Rhodococcus sp. OK519]GBF17673.1 hypothetical protein Br6_05080 [Rhodococcus sp. Br-6]